MGKITIDELDQSLIDLIGSGGRSEDKFAGISGVDINSPNVFTDGSLTTDINSSHGQCYVINSSTAGNQTIFSANLSEIKYGHYAICLRMKINTATTNDIIRLSVLNDGRTIMSKKFNGSEFEDINKYQYLYSTFVYESTNMAKTNLNIRIEVLSVDGIEVRFDYAYVNMIMPSIYS